VAAGFRPLRDHDVAARFDGLRGVLHFAAHVHDEHTAAVAEVDEIDGHAEPGDEDGSALVDRRFALRAHVAGGGEQIDAERFGRELLELPDLIDHELGRHRGRAEASESAGFGDGGHELVVRDTAHAGEHHGMLDAESLGESRLDHGFLPESATMTVGI
jgi:hypothetical protein